MAALDSHRFIVSKPTPGSYLCKHSEDTCFDPHSLRCKALAVLASFVAGCVLLLLVILLVAISLRCRYLKLERHRRWHRRGEETEQNHLVVRPYITGGQATGSTGTWAANNVQIPINKLSAPASFPVPFIIGTRPKSTYQGGHESGVFASKRITSKALPSVHLSHPQLLSWCPSRQSPSINRSLSAKTSSTTPSIESLLMLLRDQTAAVLDVRPPRQAGNRHVP